MRRLIRYLGAWLILVMSTTAPALHLSDNSVRFGFTAVVSRSDIDTITQLLGYISQRLDRDIWPVFTSSQDEMNRLVLSGAVDLAWIDPAGFATERPMPIVAVPSRKEGPFYYSYIIVRSDRDFTGLADLQGRPFAFSNLQSFSGALAPSYEMALNGQLANRFFRPLIYTDDHDNTIKAVTGGFVDGGSISSLVFHQLESRASGLLERLRVLKRFGPYPAPPIVASPGLQKDVLSAMRLILLSMHDDDEGRAILNRLAIRHFESVDRDHYTSIKDILDTSAAHENKAR